LGEAESLIFYITPRLYEIGGYAAERKVSLGTGKVKINALDKTKHHVKSVIIHTNGKIETR